MTSRPTEPRIAPVENLTPEQRELVTTSIDDRPLNTLIGRDAGLGDDEIAAVCAPIPDGEWSEDDAALLALADDLHREERPEEVTP